MGSLPCLFFPTLWVLEEPRPHALGIYTTKSANCSWHFSAPSRLLFFTGSRGLIKFRRCHFAISVCYHVGRHEWSPQRQPQDTSKKRNVMDFLVSWRYNLNGKQVKCLTLSLRFSEYWTDPPPNRETETFFKNIFRNLDLNIFARLQLLFSLMFNFSLHCPGEGSQGLSALLKGPGSFGGMWT